MTSAQTNPPPGDVPHAPTGLRDPAIINAMADPTRYAILSAIAWGGARTIREVAERIGRKPGSLYRQFDVLEGLGLVRRAGTTETDRRDARVYEVRGDLRVVYDPDDPERIDAINQVTSSAARHAARSFARAAEAGAVARGPHRDLHMASPAGWLDDDELVEFNRRLDELTDFLGSRERRPGSRLIQTTFIMTPGQVRTTTRND